jgi:hypothetical protein
LIQYSNHQSKSIWNSFCLLVGVVLVLVLIVVPVLVLIVALVLVVSEPAINHKSYMNRIIQNPSSYVKSKSVCST